MYKPNEYRDCKETDQRYAIGAVKRLILNLPANSAFFKDVGFETGKKSLWHKYYLDVYITTEEDKSFYAKRAAYQCVHTKEQNNGMKQVS